jgi:hypothetical protein
MKLLRVVFALVAIGLATVPAAADARISLAEVKRENREATRGHCFDKCIEWEVLRCKRVSDRRAQCVGRVTWQDHSGVNTCRVINRFKQKQGDAEIYKISKRCHPA